MNKLKQKIKTAKKLAKEIKRLKKERARLIHEIVEECNHPIEAIYEKDWINYAFSPSEPPWLICSDCGYTEQGWGSGYDKLAHAEYKSLRKISCDDWAKMATVKKRQS